MVLLRPPAYSTPFKISVQTVLMIVLNNGVLKSKRMQCAMIDEKICMFHVLQMPVWQNLLSK